MNKSSAFAIIIMVGMCASASTSAQDADVGDPAALQSAFEEKVNLEVLRPHRLAVSDLNAKFAAALDRLQQAAQKSGNLEQALAIKAERDDLLAGKYDPDSDEAQTAEVLKPLRSTYRTALGRLELERDKKLRPLNDAFARQLETQLLALTKAGRLEQAAAAKNILKDLAAASSPKEGGAGQDFSAVRAFTNSLGMKFVPVKGIKGMFCIHETRRQDYNAYASDTSATDSGWKNVRKEAVPVGAEENHPVVSVSWEDAQKFCAWLSRKEGRTYRMPTDEEWSIAVGLGRSEKRPKGTTPEMLNQRTGNDFPWGEGFPPKTSDKAGNYADVAWHEKFPSNPFIEDYQDGFPTTAPVMSFKPNSAGLFDMGGNVWEWCQDWLNDAQKTHVLRGGSWHYFDRGHLLSASRYAPPPGMNYDCGFRCVLESGS
ncbi:formylglycine-generating enzyme family protein [Prosthecobacter fluviatilis]|uniref:Formylglycine-generating enzyme family protein n=1 Tax=Prosthecobacter fluviatilis TaxID=445931 RepID=A0ABW0KQK9_9BACT